MSTIIDSLFLELGFDTSKITRGQREASAAVKKTSDEFEKHGKAIEKQAANFGEAVGTSTIKLLGFFATLLMGGKAAREFIQYITNADAALGRSARNLQVSTDTLSEWQNVVKESGGSAEDATSSIQNLSSSIANIKLGHISEQFAEGWSKIAALGGKAMDWSKPLDQSMFDLSDNLKNIAAKDGPAVALQLAKMIGINEALFNVMVKGGAEMRRQTEEIKRRGIAEAGNIANAQRLQKTFADTVQAGSYLGRVMESILTPAIISVNEWLQRSAINWGNWLVEAFVRFDAFVKQVIAGWHNLVDIFGPDFAYVANHWREMLAQMEHLFGEFGTKIGESGSFLLNMFQQAFSGVFLWLKRSFNEIWGSVFGHPLFGDAGTTGGAIVEGLGYGATPHSTGGGGGDSGRERSNRMSGSGSDRGGGSPGRGEYGVKKAYDLLKGQGATDEEARTLAAIAQPESGGNPRSHNTNAATGDNSYGLWQINMLGAMGPERRAKFGLKSNEELFDPAINARVALAMHRAKGSYRDWSTYTSGAYRKYLGGEGSSSTKTGGPQSSLDISRQYAMLASHGRANAAGAVSTTNNSHQAHITINSSSGNPHEIARAVKESIDRTSYAMHGNYSLA